MRCQTYARYLLNLCRKKLRFDLDRVIAGWLTIRTARGPPDDPLTGKLNWYYNEQRQNCKELIEECMLYMDAIVCDTKRTGQDKYGFPSSWYKDVPLAIEDYEVFDEIVSYYSRLFKNNRHTMYGTCGPWMWNGETYVRQLTLCNIVSTAISSLFPRIFTQNRYYSRRSYRSKSNVVDRKGLPLKLHKSRVRSYKRQSHGSKTLSRKSQRNL